MNLRKQKVRILNGTVAGLALTCFLQLDCFVVASQERIKQSSEAVEAYHVCRQFERLIGESLQVWCAGQR